MAEVHKLHEMLVGLLKREPTDEEIAHEAGMSVKALQKLRRQTEPMISMDDPVKDEGQTTLNELVGDPDSTKGYDTIESYEDSHGLLSGLEDILTYDELRILRAKSSDGGLTKTYKELATELSLAESQVQRLWQDVYYKLRHPTSYDIVGDFVSMYSEDPVEQEAMTWKQHAACRGLEPDEYIRNPSGRTLKSSVDGRTAVCRDCRVKEECFTYAKEIRAKNGVWGGIVFVRGEARIN